jgi:hypothetical protein
MGLLSGPAFLPVVLCAVLVSSGCVAEVSTPPVVQTIISPLVTPVPESLVATVPLSGLALVKENLPAGYVLKDRTVTSYAGVGQIFRDLGWQQGYRVSYYRLDKDIDDMTMIIQEIDLYPLDTVRDVYSMKKEELLPKEDSRTDYQVPFPVTGERSIAWREIRTVGTIPVVTYSVIFTKKNVYEKISMTGTSTDYELLRELAMTAAGRIR